METRRGILIKTCSKPMHRSYTRGSLLGCSLVKSMHSLSTALLIAVPFLPYLAAKEDYRLSFSMIL